MDSALAEEGTGEPAGRVTIRTVAADAGVSIAAVSKVMRNAYGVSEALRLRVEASIERLGYRPSVAARGMRGRTFTLGVLLVGIDNPFLHGIYQGIEGVTEPQGYKIMVGVGAARTRTEASLIEQMIDNRMDGLILVASQIAGDTLEHYARQIPTVVVGHHEPGALGYDTINNDDRAGARLAVQALVERGHRDIAFLTQSDQADHQENVAPQREIGYRQAMKAAGLDDHVRVLGLAHHGPERDAQFRQILSAPDRPGAVVCWSDLDAIPLLGEMHRMGIRMPRDLAVVGCDNSPVADLSMVSLSSIDQDGPRLGQIAAETLFSRIRGRRVAEHVLVQPTLVVRGSI
jgi:LacI family transcriptional regulator